MDDRTRLYFTGYARRLREEGCTAGEIFRTLLVEFCGTPYVWGGSSLDGCDCSGSVCAALSCAFRKELRVTAHDLYRDYFTREAGSGGIEALFFLDREGHAVHVAACAGNGRYMNESSAEINRCGTLRCAAEMKVLYPRFTMVRRALDPEALK